MKVFGFVLLVVGVVLVAVYQQRIILVETYLLSTKMPHGWVVIEYENPRCKPLRDRLFERRFVIPESGYLCTSSSIYMGWHKARYYLVEEDGSWKPLVEKEWISQQNSFEMKKYSFQPSNQGNVTNLPTKCEVKGSSFWYGPPDQITIDETPLIIARHHPECR